MKVRVPAKQVEICDICNRETGILTVCNICKKEFCCICEPYLPGCYIKPDVCKKCDDREDVKLIVAKYGKQFKSLVDARAKELLRLPQHEPKSSHS